MKIIKLLPLALLFLVASCSSVRVTTDYDTKADFSEYKTFAFYKKGIDKAFTLGYDYASRALDVVVQKQ